MGSRNRGNRKPKSRAKPSGGKHPRSSQRSQVESFDTQCPTWSFVIADKQGPESLYSDRAADDLSENILPKLRSFEGMTWADIKRQTHGRSKSSNHYVQVESTGGALLPLGARFRPPLIKPDMQNYRIRLSDKIMFSPTEGPWSLAQGISSHTSCIALRVGSAPTPRTEPCACDRATGESASSCVHLCLHRRD